MGAAVFQRFRPYAPTTVFALLIFYFAVSALTGERGLLTDRTRESTLTARTVELQRLQAQRADLEQRIRLMSDSSLSADLAEERSKRTLGFTDPRDYVIRTRP